MHNAYLLPTCRIHAALGLALVAQVDATTGCSACSSFVLQSHDLTIVVTSPVANEELKPQRDASCPLPGYNPQAASAFIQRHGVSVAAIGAIQTSERRTTTQELTCVNLFILTRCVEHQRARFNTECLTATRTHVPHAGVRVNDAAAAFHVSVARGAAAVLPPVTLTDTATGTSLVVAEILAYPGGDVVLRFVSGTFEGPFVPGYARTDAAAQPPAGFGLHRVDHINIASENLSVDVDYVMNALGEHQVLCLRAAALLVQPTVHLTAGATLMSAAHLPVHIRGVTCSRECAVTARLPVHPVSLGHGQSLVPQRSYMAAIKQHP